MMIRAILIVAAIAATTLALSKGGAHADSLNIQGHTRGSEPEDAGGQHRAVAAYPGRRQRHRP